MHKVIALINQCEYTGLEKNATPIESRHYLKLFIDNYNQARLIAINEQGKHVAGMLLSGSNPRIVRFMFTLPEYRWQGYMRELLAYARLKYGRDKVRLDSHLSDDGILFALAC